MTKAKSSILFVGLTVIFSAFIVFSSFHVSTVISYAANPNISFDNTYVMDDFKNSVIDGKDYSLEENNICKDYSFDGKKKTQLFSFVEYCYSFYSDLQDNYALYVYVYNPQGIKFIADSSLNKISMRVGSDKSNEYKKYSLLYLNQCVEPNYEGLFYKYKVILSTEERQRILETVNSSERIYSVSEIQLQPQNSGVVSYYVSTDYFFDGYAAGYGADENADSTLTIKSEQCDSLSLEVSPTFYRPEGTNDKDDYTQDTLHSVYFAIPNKYLNLYGEMTAVHATWLNAVTNWGLVTGHKESYDIIRRNFIGNTPNEDMLPSMFGALPLEQGYDATGGSVMSYYVMNPDYAEKGNYPYYNPIVISKEKYENAYGAAIDPLCLVYYSGEETDSADTFTVSGSTILTDMQEYSKVHGKEVLNIYSCELFESVDEEFTEVNWDYKTDWSDKLTSRKLVRSFWDKFFGRKGSYKATDTFKDVYAVKELSESDFKSGTQADICRDLLIFEDDYAELKDLVTNSMKNSHGQKDSHGMRDENDSTVYLFRYRVSDYEAREAHRFTESGIYEYPKVRDSNNYFFKMSVDLQFDVIDVTFSNGEESTVIPVVMSPIDIIHAGTPPVYTESDNNSGCDKGISLIFMLIIVVLLLIVAMPVLPHIISGVVWVVKLPFRAVSGIAKGIKKSSNKNKKDGT